MQVSKLRVQNYRTLQDVTVNLPAFYTAICGKNDSGKTNFVRAIRCLIRENEPYGYEETPEFSVKNDFTKWVFNRGRV